LNEEDQNTPHGSGPAVAHNSSDIKRKLRYFSDENALLGGEAAAENELEETTKWQHTQAIFKPKKFSPYKF
jgi:hypothetical protein